MKTGIENEEQDDRHNANLTESCSRIRHVNNLYSCDSLSLWKRPSACSTSYVTSLGNR
jgi:hypothetical protein